VFRDTYGGGIDPHRHRPPLTRCCQPGFCNPQYRGARGWIYALCHPSSCDAHPDSGRTCPPTQLSPASQKPQPVTLDSRVYPIFWVPLGFISCQTAVPLPNNTHLARNPGCQPSDADAGRHFGGTARRPGSPRLQYFWPCPGARAGADQPTPYTATAPEAIDILRHHL
jgi:hypothetical protein